MSSDAATLPSPPKMPPGKDSRRPYSVGDDMNSSGKVNGPDSYPKAKTPLLPPRRPRFPNIKDLQDQAAALNVNDTTPVCAALTDNGRN
jgi:ubiquitin carboxyl-terminal hydrolase 8